MDLLITTLNDGDFGFKMDTCKLQKHHVRYGEGQTCEDSNEEDQLLQIESETNMGEASDVDESKKFGSNSEAFQ